MELQSTDEITTWSAQHNSRVTARGRRVCPERVACVCALACKQLLTLIKHICARQLLCILIKMATAMRRVPLLAIARWATGEMLPAVAALMLAAGSAAAPPSSCYLP